MNDFFHETNETSIVAKPSAALLQQNNTLNTNNRRSIQFNEQNISAIKNKNKKSLCSIICNNEVIFYFKILSFNFVFKVLIVNSFVLFNIKIKYK